VNYFLVLAIVLVGYMSVWFGISLVRKRNDVADEAWGLGFVVLAWWSLVIGAGLSGRGLLVGILVSIWGLRLAWHIHRRHQGKPEDSRYQQWRKDWGKWFYLRSYAQVFLFQGLLIFLVALPVMMINVAQGPQLGWFDVIGIIVWLVGFTFEAVGDAQLARFKTDPTNKGKLIQSGLWGYTRHPNYFGEVTMWWGIWLMALSAPNGMLSIIGPLTITWLILKVSGVSLLEKKMMNNPDFAEYERRTSMFIPWLRKDIRR